MHEAHSELSCFRVRDSLAVHKDLPTRISAMVPRKNLDERRLAGAVVAYQCVDFARFNIE